MTAAIYIVDNDGNVLTITAEPTGLQCSKCGCTDEDCRQCIERTGEPCSWVQLEPDPICSACFDEQLIDITDEGRAALARARRDGCGLYPAADVE